MAHLAQSTNDSAGADFPELLEQQASARVAALVVCAVLAAAWVLPVSLERSWGYDESMHAQLPALRMLHAARAGDLGGAFDVLLGCSRYPFAYPALLACVQGVFGSSELVGRALGRVLWVVGCYAIFALAQDVVRLLARGATGGPAAPAGRAAALGPWLALAFAACSPMTLMYAGTLFLEVPFAVASLFALRALLRRDPQHPGWRRRELALGGWLTLCLFTKFNYGLLLFAGVGAELLWQGLAAARRGRAVPFLRRSAWTAAPVVAGLLWWFVLPLPGGGEVAAVHRAEFAAFLAENTDASRSIGWAWRFSDWSVYLVYSPLVLVALVAGLFANLGRGLRAGLRPLLFVALALLVPPAFHTFHVDRFLIPGATVLWVLAGLGLARVLPGAWGPRAALGVPFLVLTVWTAAPLSEWSMKQVGLMPEDEASVAYARRVLAEHRSLNGARPLVTVGLWREDADALADVLAASLEDHERIGWLGISSGYSRAALHAGLLARGAPPERFLRDAGLEMFVETAQADPGFGAAELEAWADGFDVVVHTAPVDLLDHRSRRFMQRYVDLLQAGGWTCESLGTVAVADALGDARAVELFACRRAP